MGEKITLTQSKGKGNIRHNNRDFISPNVHVDRIKNNITLKKQAIADAYEQHFGQAFQNYNAKQKRANRKFKENSYFEHLFHVSPYSVEAQSVLQNKDKCKSFYEDIVQVGEMNDCGIFTDNAEIATQCLIDYYNGTDSLMLDGEKLIVPSFEERNPNLKVFNAVIHLDEATPHLQTDYIPVSTGYLRGMSVQNGYNRALAQQGYADRFIEVDGRKKPVRGFNLWRDDERDTLRKICKAYGLDVTEKADENSRHHTFTSKQYREIISSAENVLYSAYDTSYGELSDAELLSKETAEEAAADFYFTTEKARQAAQNIIDEAIDTAIAIKNDIDYEAFQTANESEIIACAVITKAEKDAAAITDTAITQANEITSKANSCAQALTEQAHNENNTLTAENKQLQTDIQRNREQIAVQVNLIEKMPHQKVFSSLFSGKKFEMDKSQYDEFIALGEMVIHCSKNTLTSDEVLQAQEEELARMKRLNDKKEQLIQQEAERIAKVITRKTIAELNAEKEKCNSLFTKEKAYIKMWACKLLDEVSPSYRKMDQSVKNKLLGDTANRLGYTPRTFNDAGAEYD